jgi:Ni/Fe-hydrogenase 1 B-type cytochrome subunit
VFFFNFAFRIYWGFVGNQFSDWRNFLPLRSAQFRQAGAVLRVDVLQATNRPIDAVGHNSLAYFTYFLMFLVFLFQVISGFAMYASMSKSWFPQLFVWAVPLFGGDFALRQWHYMAMWFFIVFTIVHVYLVFYHDYVEGHGVMSSMVGGWKFVRPDMLKGNGRSWFPLSPRSPRSEQKSAPRRPS